MCPRRRLVNCKKLLGTFLAAVMLSSFIVLSNRKDSHWLFASSLLRLPLLPLAGNTSQTLYWSRHSWKVKTPLIMKPHCRDIERVSFMACPKCFRPRVPSFKDLLLDMKLQKETLRGNSQEVFKQRPEVVQNLVSDYILSPGLACPYLLTLQLSITSRRYERDVVRQTWASVTRQQQWPHRRMNANMKILFVLGREQYTNQTSTPARKDLAEGQWPDIQAEAAQHGDILYLDLQDGYTNLTLKLLSAFKWVKDNCPCVKFVLKVDYDTFVNVPLLVDTLLYFENRFEFSILGHVYHHKSTVRRNGMWAVPANVYPLDFYPFYTSGCSYVLSYKALSKIVEAAPRVPIFSVEDAFITGVMRKVIGCDMFSLETLFTQFTQRGWNPCRMFADSMLTGTRANEDVHRSTWAVFESNGSSCVVQGAPCNNCVAQGAPCNVCGDILNHTLVDSDKNRERDGIDGDKG